MRWRQEKTDTCIEVRDSKPQLVTYIGSPISVQFRAKEVLVIDTLGLVH